MPADRRSELERILESHVEELGGGDVDIEVLCSRYPDDAEELRAMHADWMEVLGLMSGESDGRADAVDDTPETMTRVPSRPGDSTLSGVSIEPELWSEAGDSVPRQVVERLKKRQGDEPRYEIVREFNRGGMGAILEVRDRDLRRTLAMKVVLGERKSLQPEEDFRVDERTLARFVEEAQVTGQLDHPGIVPVYELGVNEEGRVFFTMRLIKGVELGEVFDHASAGRDGWTQTRAVGAILKVCETMAYAHSKGVLHRDLKPSNIMVGRYGEVYVMDWGVARLASGPCTPQAETGQAKTLSVLRTDLRADTGEGSSEITVDGEVMGTPAYMSPEQARADHEDVCPASDVYSMGAILYHLLAGHMPYVPPGTFLRPAQIWARLHKGPPTPVSKLAPKAPPELIAICEKAMARSLDQRYGSMGEIAEELYAYLEGRVVQSHRSDLSTRFRKWVGRNKPLAAALAGLFVLIFGGMAGYISLKNEALADVREEQTRTALARDEAWRESYLANIVAADASLRAGEALEGKRRLQDARGELRGWEWRHLARRSDTSLERFDRHEDGSSLLLAVDRESRLVASAAGGSLVVCQLDTGKELHRHTDQKYLVFGLSFQDDLLLTVEGTREGLENGRLRTWDANDGELLGALELPAPPSEGVAFGHFGASLAFGTTDGLVYVIDREGRTPPREFEAHDGKVLALAYSSDGHQLYSSSSDGSIYGWSLLDDESKYYEGHEAAVYDLETHGDGVTFVSASADGSVRLWKHGQASPERVLVERDASANAVAFDASGNVLLSAWSDEAIRAVDLESGDVVEFFGHDTAVRSVTFTNDEQSFASGSEDGWLRFWDLEESQAVRVLDGNEFISAIALKGDTRHVAVGSGFGDALRLHALERGGQNHVIRDTAADHAVNDLCFSPDDRLLAVAFYEPFVRLYDTERVQRNDPEPAVVDLTHSVTVTAIDFHPNGKVLATGSSHIEIWEPWTGERLREIQSDDTEGVGVLDLAYSPTGERLAAALEDGSVHIYDADTGTELFKLPVELQSTSSKLAWSPSGEWLALGGNRGILHLWNLETKALRKVEGHEGPITAIEFQSEQRLFTGSFDGSIRLWDLSREKAETLLVLRDHTRAVTDLALSADREELLSAGADDTIRLWSTIEAP